MAGTALPAPAPVTVSRDECVWVLLAIAVLCLAVFGPVLQAKFYVVEDHLLVTGHSLDLPGWIARVIGDIRTFARFRPGYWLYHAIGSLAFGVNPHLWHAATLVWGVLTCHLFYLALRTTGADIASSVAFVALLLLTGNQNWIWINLIPQETIGMLLTAVATFGITVASRRGWPGRWDAVALTAMALAGLVKESFVILIPALLLLRWTCQRCLGGQSWREALHRARLPLAVGALVFVAELTVVIAVLLSKPHGYSAEASGLAAASFDPRRWGQVVAPVLWPYRLVLAGGVVLWASLWWGRTVSRTYLLAGAGVVAAWVVPQAVLYTSGLNERYLFPAIVGIAGAIAWELSTLWRRRLWPVWALGVLLLLPPVTNGVKTTTTTVGWLTAETVATGRMVEFLAQNVPGDQAILMAGDSGTPYGFEATHAWPLYLRMARASSPFFLWPLVAKGERSALHLAASRNNTAFRYPDSLTPQAVGAIIIVDTFVPGLVWEPLVEWLGTTRWREVRFAQPYRALSIAEFKYVNAGEVVHRVLLPDGSGAGRRWR